MFRIKTSDNTSHLMTLPLSGGAFETVSSSADETMQIFGFTPAGETSYIMSHYGAGVFSGLLSVPTAKLLDGSFVAQDTTVVRAISNQPNSYVHPTARTSCSSTTRWSTPPAQRRAPTRRSPRRSCKASRLPPTTA